MKKLLWPIVLTIFLYIINIFSIYSIEIKFAQNAIYEKATLCFSFGSLLVLILRCLYKKSKDKMIKRAADLMFIAVLIVGVLLFFHPFLVVLNNFAAHKDEMCKMFRWSAIGMAFGLITSIIYFKLPEKFSFIKFASATIIFVLLNTFSGFHWVRDAPFFTGIYCLFGSFLGSELCNLCKKCNPKSTK